MFAIIRFAGVFLNDVCHYQTRFGLGHTSLHYNSLLDAVGGVDACCKPGGLAKNMQTICGVEYQSQSRRGREA